MYTLVNYYLDQAITWLKRGSAYNTAYTELNKLSDRELRDLGIYRCDIHNVVANTLRNRIPSRSF